MTKDSLKQAIRKIVTVSDSEMEIILPAFTVRNIDQGEVILEEHTICSEYYFIEKGLLRFVYHHEEKEDTSWVLFEGGFFTEIISMKYKTPTFMSLEAVEPSVVLCIDEARMNSLCDEIKAFERFLRVTWEENLLHLLQMKLMQQFENANERYDILLKDKRLMQRIPQKYLASILGITPFSLSRIRSSRKK